MRVALATSFSIATAAYILNTCHGHEIYEGRYRGFDPGPPAGYPTNLDAFLGDICWIADWCMDPNPVLPAAVCDNLSYVDENGVPVWVNPDDFWTELHEDCCVDSSPYPDAPNWPNEGIGFSSSAPGCDLTFQEVRDVWANQPYLSVLYPDPSTWSDSAVNSIPGAPPRPPECDNCIDPGPNACFTNSRDFIDQVLTNPCATGSYGGQCKVGFCGAGCGGLINLTFQNGATQDTLCEDTDGDGCIDFCPTTDFQCGSSGPCPDGGVVWANGDCNGC